MNGIQCRYDPNCTNMVCQFSHTQRKMCKWKLDCKNKKCTFDHGTVDGLHPLLSEQASHGPVASITSRRNETDDEIMMDINAECEHVLKQHQAEIRQVEMLCTTGGKSRKRRAAMDLNAFHRWSEEERVQRIRLHELERQEAEFNKEVNRLREELDFDVEGRDSIVEQMKREVRRLKHRLPIYAYRSQIVDVVYDNPITLLIGETGSGKTTQLVQYLCDAGFSRIVCTQPRKVAAASLAKRVAEEFGCEPGTQVGVYDPKKSQQRDRKITFMTDRALLNKIIEDESLREFDVVIIDEAHERTIDTDLLLGMVKSCLDKRPNMRLVVTSATLDDKLFRNYFNQCPVIKIPGRTFPVDIIHSKLTDEDYVTSAVEQTALLVRSEKEEDKGDVLVFLTGQQEIEAACTLLNNVLGTDRKKALILPLHGKLPPEEQQKVFEPSDVRKVIFATNAAESSITIDGVRFVIDTGRVKENRFDPARNMNVLELSFITKSAAIQRAGRAGRTSPGRCYRLYSESDYELFPPHRLPEILRVDLGMAILKLKSMGIQSVERFDFIERPSDESIKASLSLLYMLGALSKDGHLTKLGEQMAILELSPPLAKMIIRSVERSCLHSMASIVAMLTVSGTVYWRGRTDEAKKEADHTKALFCSKHGDFITLLNIYREYSQTSSKQRNEWCKKKYLNSKSMSYARQLRNDIIRTLRANQKKFALRILDVDSDAEHNAEDSDTDTDTETLLRIIAEAYFFNLSFINGDETSNAGYHIHSSSTNALIHPSSALVPLGVRPRWILYQELSQTSRLFLRNVSVVDPEWIIEDSPLYAEAINLRSLMEVPKHRKLEPIVFAPYGPAIIASIVGRHGTLLSQIERELDIVIEPKFDEFAIRIWVKKSEMKKTKEAFHKILQEKRERLENQTMEVPIVGSTRAILQRGGTVQQLLLHNDYISVNLSQLPHTITEEMLMDELKKFGTVSALHLFKDPSSKNSWAHVTFATVDEAREIIEKGLFLNGSSVTIHRRETFTPESRGHMQESTVKVRWFVGHSKGYGRVAFTSERSRNQALCEMDGFRIHSRNIQLSIMSKEQCLPHKTLYGIYIKNLDQFVDETDLEEAFRKFGYFDHATVMRDVPESHISLHTEYTKLQSIFNQFGKIEHMSMFPPERGKSAGKAYITFASAQMATEAINAVDGKTGLYGDGRLRCTADLSFRYSIWSTMFAKLRPLIEECKHAAQEEFGVRVSIPEREGKKSATIKIEGFKLEDTAKAKALFDEMVMKGVVVPDIEDISILRTKEGKALVDHVEQENRCYISVDPNRRTVMVFGPPAERQKIAKELSAQIKKIPVRISWKKRLQPGGVKILVENFGTRFKKLTEKHELYQAAFNMFRQELTITGSEEAVRQAMEEVEHVLKNADPKRAVNRNFISISGVADGNAIRCPICYDDDIPEFERMCLQCGHVYCKMCFENQVESVLSDRSFPIKCVHCNDPVVLSDIFIVLKSEQLERFYQASFGKFTMMNAATYRPCLTPGCVQVYRAGEDVFQCDVCLHKYCTKCEVDYHTGLTCEQYELSKKQNDDSLKEWLSQSGADVKPCPGCGVMIEKESGCNRLNCTQCNAHICWFCSGTFATPGDVYSHMQAEHGDYWG